MSLLDWRVQRHSIGSEVRTIIEFETGRVPTAVECREWVRRFIRRYVPTWQPGEVLDREAARLIGSAFERMVAKARRELRRLGK